MRKRRFIGSMLTFVIASTFVLVSCTNKTKQEEAREEINEEVVEIKQDIDEAIRDFKSYTYSQR